MRTKDQLEEFEQQAQMIRYRCKECRGLDHNCKCFNDYLVSKGQYEACIPRDFWNVKSKEISHNKGVFDNVINKYCKKLNKALKGGYGLALLGSNGVGKTYFISYVLSKAIRKGRSAYYTTMPQLSYDIKASFGDKEKTKRLEYYLTSDFVAIDELGKERLSKKNRAEEVSFIDTEIERLMKSRCDDSLPVILATNMNQQDMFSSYGSTIGSIILGKLKIVSLKDGDFRVNLAKKMNEEMGY